MIPLSSPYIDDQDRAAVLDVLSGQTLSIGPVIVEFERALAAAANRRHAVAVCSGTAALHLIVRALGWGPGDEVITTPFSFVASTNCLIYEGVRPVFVDIDPVTRCIDVDAMTRAITPRTRGVVTVDVFGYPAEWGRIETVVREHGLQWINDCCESIGSGRLVDGTRVRAGQSGDAGAFAFYPNKQITTGEGGAVVTDRDDIAALCRSMRNQGRDEGAGWLQHARLGYNFRMSEINAALGLSQLRKLETIVTRRQMVAQRYLDLLAPLGNAVVLPPSLKDGTLSWFVFVVQLGEDYTMADRDRVLALLRADGVACSNYFSPIHLQPYVSAALGTRRGDYPVTEAVADRTIALPFFTELKPDAQEHVVASLGSALGRLRATR